MNDDPRHQLLGIRFNALNIADLHARIAGCIQTSRRAVVASLNLHSAALIQHNPDMARFYEQADWVRIDGMPLVYFGRLLGLPLRRDHRVTWVDWLPKLMTEAAARNWRIFYIGSKPEIVAKAADILRQQHPGLQFITQHGYFDTTPDSADNQELLTRINQCQPHILMVGMGMPRQERWIADNLAHLKVNAILPCGASLDYVAGATATPPRWMGQCGLEWLYRLCAEPRRLWRRYMVEPWILFIPACRDVLRRIAGLFKRKPRH